ncbi:multidrug/biocide efflux PACE transporter [Chromobacterium sp. IIBBL 290-4]|uniref:multidrug/biocide efflux PACE transporter n=1 Tax=Chromobacterium sp. IIBBL 290-4 TaxID=2953890 RepID=UPI0020B6A0CB|nr:multidrug/biocide efflux PACE transporter [Chromobacterium sp. IIBBL 290-4]UTH73437.1 multidrug/biocide efflux PACE transporter [Chromobacterium sp. IIBBL 290-4]
MRELGKPWWERILHAVLYEVCAMAMLVPLSAMLTGQDMAHMGALALMMSLTAMAWNMAFNALFERLERARGWRRTPWVRCGHALGFEGGLVVMLVPLAAWWLNTGWWQALLLDLGFFAFFLPYTYVFNWLYDHFRARVAGRKMAAAQG